MHTTLRPRLNSRRYGLHIAAVFALGLAPSTRIAAQNAIDLRSAATSWTVFNRSASVLDSGGRTILRLTDKPNGGMIWNPSLRMQDGEINVDVRGRDVFQKSFLGVAFHVASGDSLDVVWLRPFNFRAADSARHAHAVQYAAYPNASWEKLRADHPGAFEAAFPGNGDPDAWHHLRLILRGEDLTVYIDGAATPVLHVQTKGGRTTGGIGLWVGDQSPGDFANLTVQPLR